MISICFILFLLISILTSSYGQVTCASGWVLNGETCYLFNPAFNSGSTTGTWDQCNAYCAASLGCQSAKLRGSSICEVGATMLCVNNAAENDWMNSQYERHDGWIGYTDMPPYGGGKGTKQYGWVTGCSSTYTNWYNVTGEPNNEYDNEDYAHIWGHLNSWNDETPQKTMRCGCQYKLSTPEGSVSE